MKGYFKLRVKRITQESGGHHFVTFGVEDNQRVPDDKRNLNEASGEGVLQFICGAARC